jgi:hypothetical protein
MCSIGMARIAVGRRGAAAQIEARIKSALATLPPKTVPQRRS